MYSIPFQLAAAWILITSGWASAPVVQTQDSLIPRQLLFAPPEQTDVRLSPDGSQLAILEMSGDGQSIRIVERARPDRSRVVPIGADRVRAWRWMPNGVQMILGQESAVLGRTTVRVLEVAEGQVRPLLPGDDGSGSIVSTSARFPDEVVIRLVSHERSSSDYWRVNTRTLERQIACRDTSGFEAVLFGDRLRPRLGVRSLGRDGRTVFTLDDAGKIIGELIHWPERESLNSRVLGISGDGARVFLADSMNAETAGAFEFITAEMGSPTYSKRGGRTDEDVVEALIHPTTGKLQAVRYGGFQPKWEAVDRVVGRDVQFLDEACPDGFDIIGRNKWDGLWIIRREWIDRPAEYLVFDRGRQALDQVRLRAEPAPVAAAGISRVVGFPARHGGTLWAQLTVADHGQGDAPRPMVLLVRDEPWAPLYAGYDPVHNWLADRGYAVLTVAHRGRPGQGRAFAVSGLGELAGAMSDDLVDAVLWAVDSGVADPDRVAILGTGWGGCLALIGLSFTPEFYTAGIAINPPIDLAGFVDRSTPDVQLRLRHLLGAEADPHRLASSSPLDRADRIVRPLLLIEGLLNPQLDSNSSDSLVEVMQENGVPVTHLLLADEARLIERSNNLVAVAGVMELFLGQHLGGRVEPLGDDVGAGSIQVRAGLEELAGLSDAVNKKTRPID